MIFGGLAAGIAIAALAQTTPEFVPEFKLPCHPSTTVFDTPPKDPSADPFGNGPWYVNEKRTLWAGWQPFASGPAGTRILWIKPRGAKIEIQGRRLSGEPLSVKVESNSSYVEKGFEPNRLVFPEAGCWEITAISGKDELTFVVEVKAP